MNSRPGFGVVAARGALSSTAACALIGAAGLACSANAESTTEPPLAASAAAPECVTASAGDGFVSVPLDASEILATVAFTATASTANLDAVIGLSAGPATGFADLVTAVRFAPSGTIDVRDGDAYRADVATAYGTGPLDFRLIADLTSRTYSVFQGTWQSANELARQYAFRGDPRVARLSELVLEVDSPQGSITVCHARNQPSRGVAYSREGNYHVLPLAGDQALISDGRVTRKLDAGGRVVGQIARGDALATDPAGDVFVARIADTVLTLDKFGPDLSHVWTASRSVPAGTAIQALVVDPSGTAQVAGGSWSARTATVARFTADGQLASQLAVPGSSVALDADQPIVAAFDGASSLQITRYDAAGAAVWQRSYAGAVRISAMTVDPGHNLLFGGDLFTDMNFGGQTLRFVRTDTGPQNAFVVELSPAGDHVFSRKTGDSYLNGIAADGARIVVSATLQTQFQYAHLEQYDPSGAFTRELYGSTGLGEGGYAGEVAMSGAGRVWWNLFTEWPQFPKWPYLVALAL